MLRGLSIAALALGLAASVAQAEPTAARLQLAGAQPLAVRGTAFKPGERVVVYVEKSGERRYRWSVASRAGTFRVRFAMALRPCEQFSIRAFGTRGSRATLHSGFQLDCEPDT